MIGRVLKRVIKSQSQDTIGKVSIDNHDIDETGVDIVEALVLVNSVSDVDASKDFNEKEISISQFMNHHEERRVKESKKECIGEPFKRQQAPMVRKQNNETLSTNNHKIKQKLRSLFQPKLSQKNKTAIRRGKQRFIREYCHHFHGVFSFCLPEAENITSYPDFKQDLANEFRRNGFPTKSFSKYCYLDNDFFDKIELSTKFYTTKDQHWMPSKLQIIVQRKVLIIHTTSKQSFNVEIKGIDFVKVDILIKRLTC